jgi:FtsP/CotA-like multicopper oxidase with cupredoxin domain
MHSDLPAVVGGKTNPAATGGTKLRGYVQEVNGVPVGDPHYLGPLIIATKDRPVRIKFTNRLPIGTAGNLFIPTDTTIMGSGDFEINYDPLTKAPIPNVTGIFTQNRATIHLHGGRTPWISDGTPHQWITPVGETTPYPRGVSVQNVPDMWFDASGNTIAACAGQTTCATPGATNNPGPGSQTFYYTNQQSARLMFYHDHAWGITRLNVYVGEAAGYLLTDTVEQQLITGGLIPSEQIPLIIQDKTFVNAATIMTTDPTWAWGTNPAKPATLTPKTGDLWWPHVYMPAQNPYNPDMTGMNAMGRWHYGPWFFPSTPLCGSSPNAVLPYCINNGPVPNPYYNAACVPSPTVFCQPPEMPGAPNPSWGAEAFLDTMLVNGTAYPTLPVQAKPYRFRILNASHDRFLNLQLYKASPIIGSITLISVGSGYTSAPTVTTIGDGTGATATATVDLTPGSPTFGQVTAVTLASVGSGYTTAAIAITGGGGAGAAATATVYTALKEVGMVPAALNSGFPPNWPADGREGGVPDPAKRGPAFIQIGTEGGFLPAPVLLPNQPVAWNLDPTMFNVGNVLQQADGGGTLFLGPAERADVIVDFTNFSGQTLILYNDAPTAFPALDPHYDYYTGAPDRTDIGGYVAIPPGVGPNIRTVMQITVAPGGSTTALPDDYNLATLTALQNAFRSTPGSPGVFERGQNPIVVGQSAYNSTYNTTFPATWPNWGISRISDNSISFQRVDGTIASNFPMKPKAIHDEMGATFDDYGRMSAKLGLEVPFTNAAIANFVLQNYVDPPTELFSNGEVQIWKITHNGVDTHPIHFHLFEVQLINRVGWDGFIRLPDPNELGWKDTVRIAPLEDTIVAIRLALPQVPFRVPNSVRPLNPSTPLGSMMGFSQIDTQTGGALATPTTNQLYNFGHEYVWHCHILSHEENDMMRSIVVRPRAPADFDGDKKTDISIYQSNIGAWYISPSSGSPAYGVGWGGTGYTHIPGDYDGDGKTDIAVYEASTGVWYVKPSSGVADYVVGWGGTGYTPVPGDYDGDGKTDIAVYEVSTGVWYIKPSSGAPAYVVGWGGIGYTPIPGDYDGDGKMDIAVYQASTAAWYIQPSSGAAAYVVGWGGTGYTPIPGEYDGDGKTDIAVYQTSTGAWYIQPSSGAAAYVVGWGGTGYTPIPGDYDQDGIADIAVYQGSTGAWYVKPSSGAPAYGVGWGGGVSDLPVTEVTLF